MKEILLGFQLRVNPLHIELWESERRETYLIREDIIHPLSVDRDVWPENNNKENLSYIFSNYHNGAYRAPNGLNLYTLSTPQLLGQKEDIDDALLIGITVVNYNMDIDHAQHLRSMHAILDIQYSIEQLLRNDWMFLGYDVADYWLYSCLMNCGFDLNYKKDSFKRFADEINEHGLFATAGTAKDFLVDCESRIKEHAPFAIYGIWCPSGK
jgi:hypothetical protein